MVKYKVLRFFVILFAIFALIMFISGVATAKGDNFVIILSIIFLIIFIVFVVFSVKLKKKIKQPIIEAKQKAAAKYQRKLLEHQNHMSEMGAVMEIYGKHAYGLPVSEDAETQCYWCYDKIVFETSGTSFNLSFEKLTDVASKTDREIETAVSKQDQYVSSTGRAVAGYMLLGPLGAAIGGRARKKTVTNQTMITKSISHYLIFTYIDNDEVKCAAFEIFNTDDAQRFVNEFQKIKPAQMQSFDL